MGWTYVSIHHDHPAKPVRWNTDVIDDILQISMDVWIIKQQIHHLPDEALSDYQIRSMTKLLMPQV